MSIPFSKDQVDIIEDRVCNILNPVYGTLGIALEKRKKVSFADMEKMQSQIDDLVGWVRGLRQCR